MRESWQVTLYKLPMAVFKKNCHAILRRPPFNNTATNAFKEQTEFIRFVRHTDARIEDTKDWSANNLPTVSLGGSDTDNWKATGNNRQEISENNYLFPENYRNTNQFHHQDNFPQKRM